MLQEIYTNVTANLSFAEISSASERNTQRTKAREILSAACKAYNDLSSVDKVSALREKVQLVTEQMEKNIDLELQSTVKAERMELQAEQLQQEAQQFRDNSGKLKGQMAWKNLKTNLLVGAIILAILLAILAPLIKKSRD